MRDMEFIMFDCMETLVDLARLPNLRDYAAWGFEGSGVEGLWKDFDEYFQYFLLSKADMAASKPEHYEFEMRDRFRHIVGLSFPGMDPVKAEEAVRRIDENYWRNYKALSYVKDDVLKVLPQLSESFRLGVVSNFMVTDGIEEMLQMHGIKSCFEFVVTSIAEGWRKPHPAIYGKALSLSGVPADKTVFVGDDYINDYVAPAKLGMRPVYLDRYDRHPELAGRVKDFHQLRQLLLG